MNKIFVSKCGNLSLELRKESASAWLTIKRSGRLINERDILQLIDEAGIKSGFEEALDYIRDHDIEKDYDKPFPIAVCKISPDNEEEIEAKLNYNFDHELIRDINSIGLKELAQASYFDEGEVIAFYSDNIFDRDGSIYDIFGQLITPPVVDDEAARELVGKNVRYEAREFIAQKMGYPYLDEEGKINILDSLSVNADDVPIQEQIRCPLFLRIEGDLSGVNLACGQELIIEGDVTDCNIYCEQDLEVHGNIINCSNPGIQSMGVLKVRNISRSKIFVQKSLFFQDEIAHSVIAADGDVVGSSEDSQVYGGLCQAAGNITIGIAGSQSGDETEIEIAISPFYRALLMQLTKESVRLRESGDHEALSELSKRIKRCEAELDSQLNAFLKRDLDEQKSITVFGDVFPKTLFRVLKHSYQIKSRQQGIYLLEQE
ncbi:MAG: FapA family protein [Candidatus Cloacimonetes bacterium]|jgi:uncharacterized protein (DUF342 family)|nr:FapA family protein [Candidatus Cloacimonadota bacterium]NLO43339.1 DUF342 domain-containing protein [Candidatus Cloacimonadota bacterium]